MLPKNCGQLLFNAVRETLETMAFAEVVLCSIKVGGEEFAQDEMFSAGGGGAPEGSSGGWGDVPSAAMTDSRATDTWGTAVPDMPTDDPWGAVPEVSSVSDSWGSSSPDAPEQGTSWGEVDPSSPIDDDSWGESGIILPDKDPWGESAAMAQNTESMFSPPKEADFDAMVEEMKKSDEWCWACMKVNSPDIHSVWFIVTKGLANALAMNMYAGEDFQLDNPIIRDLIAELTNVLGGRLMLLLEELGGKFTLTVPEIGFGLPDVPEIGYETAVCKVVVDSEHPVIAALCFNPGGIVATGA